MPQGKLSTAKVRNAKPGLHPDGGGLYLQVTVGKDGTINKSWLFRFTLRGKERRMGLGSFNTVGLGDARDKAREARALVLRGRDPIEERDVRRGNQADQKSKTVTFEWCAVRYMAAHEAGWRNAIHRRQWHTTLSTYAYPVIGKVPVDAIDAAMVLQVIEPIWTEKNETASRVRGRIGRILDSAAVHKHRPRGPNPAAWNGNLVYMLPARSKVHRVENHPALPWQQMPAFMADLRDMRATGPERWNSPS